MISDHEFGLTFDGVWPNPGGDVLIRFIDQNNGRWAVKPGSSYKPEVHLYGHVLTIERGRGLILVGEEKLPYEAGRSFDVPKGTAHCIVQVDEPTLVHQRNY